MTTFFSSLTKLTKRGTKSSKRKASVQLALEALEDRFMPAAGMREQYILELVNRMRENPAAEINLLLNSNDEDVKFALTYFGVKLDVLKEQWSKLEPAAPLAWDDRLAKAALDHSKLMLELDQQDHVLPGEKGIGERISDAGYPHNSWGENIYAYAKSLFHGYVGWAIDWGNGPVDTDGDGIYDPKPGHEQPGHRENIMSTDFRETGIGIVDATAGKKTGPLLLTQDFGNRQAFGNPWLLGVVFTDKNTDGFYSEGEGKAGEVVTIVKDGQTLTTTTSAAGGYQIQLAPGTYTVSAFGGVRSVTIADANKRVNFNGDESSTSNTTPVPPSGPVRDISGLSAIAAPVGFPGANNSQVTHRGRSYTAATNENEYVYIELAGQHHYFGDQAKARGAPTLAVFEDKLFIAWTGTDGTDDIDLNPYGHLNVAVVSLDPSGVPLSLTGQVVLDQISNHAPSLAAHGGALFLAWSGVGNDHLNIAFSLDGRNFTTHVSSDRTKMTPWLVSFSGTLYVGFIGTDGASNLKRVNLVLANPGQALSTFPLVDGILTITGDQSKAGQKDGLTIDRTSTGGVWVSLNGKSATFKAGEVFAIKVNTGTGDDTVAIYGASVPINITSNGYVTVNLGNQSSGLDRLTRDLTVNGSGRGQLLVTDYTANKTNYELGTQQFLYVGVGGLIDFYTFRTLDRVSYLRMPLSTDPQGPAIEYPIASNRIFLSGLDNVVINAGPARNRFTVADDAGRYDPAKSMAVTLNTGTNDDVVQVKSSTGLVTINGMRGNDEVTIGGPWGTQYIAKGVNVTNATGHTSLLIDDAVGTQGRLAMLTGGSVTGSVQGIAPGLITYNVATPSKGGVSNLKVLGGSGNNIFHVFSTTGTRVASTLSVQPYFKTNLETGAGNDNVYIYTTSGPINVDAQAGQNVVIVGGQAGILGKLDGILGAVSLYGTGGTNFYTIDDRAAKVKRTVSLTDTSLNAGTAKSGPKPISYHDVFSLAFRGGDKGNTFNVHNTPTGPLEGANTRLQTGNGVDYVNVYATTGLLSIDLQRGKSGLSEPVQIGGVGRSLDAIQGSMLVVGTDYQANISDAGDTNNHNVIIDDIVQRSGAAAINVVGAWSLVYTGGKGQDDINVQKNPARGWTRIEGNDGDDRIKIAANAGTVTANGDAGNDVMLGHGHWMFGGTGRDLLSAGTAAAILLGGMDDDIMLGGTLDLDATAIDSVMAEWTRTDAEYAARVEHLRFGGGLNGAALLNLASFTGNGLKNELDGGLELDLFYGSKTKDTHDWQSNLGEVFVDATLGSTVIDASALSGTNVWLDGVVHPLSEPFKVDLKAGTHHLMTYTGASVDFAVNADGIVTYDPALEGVLSGAGTRTLAVHGRSVRIESMLSTPYLYVDYAVITLTEPSTVNLLPGSHNVQTYGSATVWFEVAVDGTVSYDAALEGVLTGQGTTALAVHGRSVHLENALSISTLLVDYGSVYLTTPSATVNLLPGSHNFQTSGSATVWFEVAADGTVHYDAALEGALVGQGTSTLTVHGRSVHIASALSTPYLFINYGAIMVTESATVKLLPGSQNVQTYGSATVWFEVAADGTVSYDAALDGVLAGQGTSTLAVHGRSVRIENQLSTSTLIVNYEALTVTESATLRLLPGSQNFQTYGGTAVWFEIALDGTVQYDAALAGILAGHGTTTLTIIGRQITIDATGLGVYWLQHDWETFDPSAPLPRRLLPGQHHVYYGGEVLWFTVKEDGTIDYDASFDGLLSGRGTQTLTLL